MIMSKMETSNAREGHMAGVLHVTDETFRTEVLDSELPSVVDFYADWCGPCRIVSPIMEELSKEYTGKVRVVKVNIDENNDLASRYGVMSIPTTILFKRGQEATRLVGAASRERYEQIINRQLVD